MLCHWISSNSAKKDKNKRTDQIQWFQQFPGMLLAGKEETHETSVADSKWFEEGPGKDGSFAFPAGLSDGHCTYLRSGVVTRAQIACMK